MSFGYYDKDWVDPPDEEPIKCRDCEYWDPCPCGCDWGRCTEHDWFCDAEDEC